MSENPYQVDQLSDLPPTPSRKTISCVGLLCVIAILFVLVGLFLPATRRARPASYRMSCSNNLKQIALALHNYEAAYGSFPPAWTVDEDGNRLHSWRTLLLPYLEYKPLYDTIDLSKPWNDPVNDEAFATRIPVFECPGAKLGACQMSYLAVVSPGSCLQAGYGRPMSWVSDAMNETLLLIEVPASQSVHWMCPQDIDEQGVIELGRDGKLSHKSGMMGAMVDGSVHFFSADTEPELWRKLISIAGGEEVSVK